MRPARTSNRQASDTAVCAIRCAPAKGLPDMRVGTADMMALPRSRDGLRANWATLIRRICGAVAIATVIGAADLAIVPSQPAIAATGLVAAYAFDEGSGA